MPYVIAYNYNFKPLIINTRFNVLHGKPKNTNVIFNEVVIYLTQKMNGIRWILLLQPRGLLSLSSSFARMSTIQDPLRIQHYF